MDELVSIVVPAFQEEKRIERCLQSILASTYKNLEIVVVNDGSTDDTEKTVLRFKEKHGLQESMIKIYSIPHGGSAKARNYGLHFVRGKYIGFVDADDMIHASMIEKLVESIDRGNDLSTCGLLFCNGEGRPKLCQYRLKGQRVRCPQQALTMVMWEQIQMSLCSVLFRREIIMDAEGNPVILCPEDVVAFEDFAFVCKYISYCNGFMEIVPFRGYFYCKHERSSSTNRYTVKEICYALKPIMDVGNRIKSEDFVAHKLQYAFRFMVYWYEESMRGNKDDFSPACEDWKVCMRELERYVGFYMSAPNVAVYKKIAMWIVRKHPHAGRALTNAISRLLLIWRSSS